MRAHLHDLRAEVDDDVLTGIAKGFREAPIADADRALLEYAEKLSLKPQDMGPSDVEELRAIGFDDRSISDATQVVGYFSYINRIADGLGVEEEDDIPPFPWETG